jgi:hypothetical protein
MEEMIEKLAARIAVEILKQPRRTIRPDEALISSGTPARSANREKFLLEIKA